MAQTFEDFSNDLTGPDDTTPAAAPKGGNATATPAAAPAHATYEDFASDLGDAAAPPPPAAKPGPTDKTFSGTILPVSRYGDGHVAFDPDAGVVGMATRALQGAWGGLTLPGDVATGKTNVNSPEAVGRSFDLAGLVSPVGAGARGSEGLIPGITASNVPDIETPTAAELHATGNADRSALRSANVRYDPTSVAMAMAAYQHGLNAMGSTADATLAPATHRFLDDMQAIPDGASDVPLDQLDTRRRMFGNLYKSNIVSNPTEANAARGAQNAIDSFVKNAGPQDVVAGPAAAAGTTWGDAIANQAAGFRSDRINDREEAAGLRAAGANSGHNTGNAIRQRTASLLLNPKASAGFSSDELSALEQVVRGTKGSNTSRLIGNLLGGGGGMHSFLSGATGMGAGYEAAGVPGAVAGAALPIIGGAAKGLSNKLTANQLQAADELVRQRSPLFQARKAAANAAASPPYVTSTAARAAPARGALEDAATSADASAANAKPLLDTTGKPIPADTEIYAKGGRVARKEGGAVKPTQEQLLARLISRVEKAKRDLKSETKPLLNVSDDTIARALAIAHKAIST